MEEKKTEFINESTDLQACQKKDLTIHTESVKLDIRKYWDRNYIKAKIQDIENTRHKMLIQFLWMSGVRITEAVSLQKQDINFRDYLMTVKWLKSRKYLRRVVPLHPILKEILEVYVAPFNLEDRVFSMTRQRAWQLTKKYLGGHPHQLRHSFAVNWLMCGGDIVILHKILGHAKLQTTMEYLKIVPIDQGKELMKIEF